MTYTQEKILFGLPTMVGSMLCSMGAIMTSGEIRWIYVTLAVGVMCSAFLALLFRKPGESMRLVVGRCGLSIMLSVFGSKLVVHFYQIAGVDDDVLLLAGLSMGICIVGYFLGHAFLRALDTNSSSLIGDIWGLLVTILKSLLTRKP